MPPKRKAAQTEADDEPPHTRRRTRNTPAPDTAPVTESLPLKRIRRGTRVDNEPTELPASQSSTSATTATKPASRTTRTRKPASRAQDVEEPQPVAAPKRRARTKKIVEEEEVPTEAAPQPQPLSPIQEKPAPKRRSRAPRKVQAAEGSQAPEGPPPKRTRRTKPSASAAEPHNAPLPEPEQVSSREGGSTSTPKKRGRRKAPVPPELSPVRQPSPTKAATPRPVKEGEESSEDELLLTTSKPGNARLTTPLRTGEANGGTTPRMFLHYVEILTPRRMLASARPDRGSPDRGSPGLRQPAVAHIPPAGTPRLPAAFPSTGGSPSKRQPPPPSAGRQRAVRTPSPGPLVPRLPGLLAPESPSRASRRAVPLSPSKGKGKQREQPIEELPRILPQHLHPLLERQKGAILRSLQRPPEIDEIEVYGEDYPPTNNAAYEQLSDLLQGTVVRGEGNSCLLIGPSGSGKTQLVEKAIAELPSKPIVVRLSGHAQHNDRLAIREIAWQLAQQTGQSFLPNDPEDADDEESGAAALAEHEHPVDPEPDVDHDADVDAEADEDDNPFLDSARPPVPAPDSVAPTIALPPPAHLLALISMIPTLPRPTIVLLDGFDLFATHARQALLYCLLDTAQACRTGTGFGSGSGMAVVGVTARIDTINLLEKRVKSRFSGRMIRTACPAKVEHWVELAKATFGASVMSGSAKESADEREWGRMWAKAVEAFVGSEDVFESLKETYALTRDFQMFRRIMTRLVLELSPSSPYPTVAKLDSATKKQRCPPRLPALETLPYPAVCLLIASVHASTSGHDTFTFEMLHDAFKTQVRTSQSAPVQIAGGGVGMMRCSREVLFSAFERLVELRVFLPAGALAASVAREFALHRNAVDRFEVRRAVDAIGQLSLKKWFTKA